MVGCTLTLVKNKPVVVIGRFIQGLSAGTFSVFVPSFINEITPTELKGPIGSSTQLFITLGILISYLLGIPLPDCDEKVTEKSSNLFCNVGPNLRHVYYEDGFIGNDYWRVVFAIPISISILQSILLFTAFNYETPKFLKTHGNEAELNVIMGKLY